MPMLILIGEILWEKYFISFCFDICLNFIILFWKLRVIEIDHDYDYAQEKVSIEK